MPRSLNFAASLFGLTLAIVIPCWAPYQAAQAQRREQRSIELEVGQQRTIPNDGVESFSIGVDEQVIDVRISPAGDLVVVGTSAGTNTLLLLFGDGSEILYSVRVSDPDAVTVPRRDNIQLDFYFVQLQEDYSYQIGLALPTQVEINPQIQLEFDAGFRTATTASVAAVPLPRIDLLERSGWARMLRQASIVTANGEPASFTGQQEVNIVAATGLAASVQSVSAGASVNVTPQYDPETGRIDVRVTAEMSDMTAGVGEVPGRLVSTIDTKVNLEMGQSIVLAGLVSDSSGAGRGGLPFVSQIPILGVLFGTHTSRRAYAQTVLFIIPSVVDTVSSTARTHINDALQSYWDYTGGLDDQRLFAPGSGPSPLHPDALESGSRSVEPTTRRRRPGRRQRVRPPANSPQQNQR